MRLTGLLAAVALLALGARPVTAQGYLTDPAEHMAFLANPLSIFLAEPPPQGDVAEADAHVAIRLDFLLEDIEERLQAAGLPEGFERTLVEAWRDFHRRNREALDHFGRVRIPDPSVDRITPPDDPALVEARNALRSTFASSVQTIQSATGTFAMQHMAAMQGLPCRRLQAVWSITSGPQLARESFMGALGLPGRADVATLGGAEPKQRTRVVASDLAAQLAACRVEGVPEWTLSERESENGLEFLLTTDGKPWTAPGLPDGPHVRIVAGWNTVALSLKH